MMTDWQKLQLIVRIHGKGGVVAVTDPLSRAMVADLAHDGYGTLTRAGDRFTLARGVLALADLLSRTDVAKEQRPGYTLSMSQMVDAIREAIQASDETPGAIARGASVARSQLSRLLSGERGLNTATIERLADYLGLEIIIRPKRRRKGR